MEASSSTTCQYCLLDDETVQHFLTDCEHWSRERRLCGMTDCDAYVILHGNNIADIKNLLKFVRLTRRLKRGLSIQWSKTGSKSYVFARIRAFKLDPNKPSSSSSIDSGCSMSRCSLCSIDGGSRVQLLVSTVCWMTRLFNIFSLTVSIGVVREGYEVSLIVMLMYSFMETILLTSRTS